MSSYDLALKNPHLQGKDAPGTLYKDQTNSLELTVTNNGLYDITFGNGQTCATLKVQMTAAAMATAPWTVAKPWQISSKPAKQGDNWVMEVAPTSTVTLGKSGGTMSLTIGNIKPTASGPTDVTVSCPLVSMTAQATATVKAAAQVSDDDLFGVANPLQLKVTLDNPEGIFVSPPVTKTSSKVENKLHVQVTFTPDALPAAAKKDHPEHLLGTWASEAKNRPFFEITFPFFTNSASDGSKELDLTDAFKVGEPGYNSWTTGWNITCSLKRDEVATKDDRWQITTLTNHPYPVWRLTPLKADIFEGNAQNDDPNQFLDLYFGHIYSALPINANVPHTTMSFQWFNFTDYNSKSQKRILGYRDSGILTSLTKIPVPNIERFELVPESYVSTLKGVTYSNTYADANGTYAVYPANANLRFRFRWDISVPDKQTASKYTIQLRPPNGAFSAVGTVADEAVVANSAQHTIDTQTDPEQANGEWELRIQHSSGTIVGNRKIRPFVPLSDFLLVYLPGKIYTAGGKLPSYKVASIAFTSTQHANIVNPMASLELATQWTLTPQNDGSIVVTLDNLPSYKLTYLEGSDGWSFTDGTHTQTLSSSLISWVTITDMQKATQPDMPAMQLLDRRMYVAYRDMQHNKLLFTSSADGWNWENPHNIPSTPAESAVPPGLVRFNNQWVVSYVAGHGNLTLLTSDDGVNWSNAHELNLKPEDPARTKSPAQLIVHRDHLFAYANNQTDGYLYLAFSFKVEGPWTYTRMKSSGAMGLLFESQGELFVAFVNNFNTAELRMLTVSSSASFYKTLGWASIGTVKTDTGNLGFAAGQALSGSSMAYLYRPLTGTGDFNSYIRIANSPQGLLTSPDQVALNYGAFKSSIGLFKNFLLRVMQLAQVGYFQSQKTLFSWPDVVAGGINSTNQATSLTTLTVAGITTLYLAYLDSANHLQIATSHDGSTWTPLGAPLTSLSIKSFTLHSYDWKLWLAYTTHDNQVITVTSTDGKSWQEQQFVRGSANKAPVFIDAEKEEALYLLLSDQSAINWYRFGAHGWVNESAKGNRQFPSKLTQVAATTFQQNIYAATVDDTNKLSIRYVTAFGNGWGTLTGVPDIQADQGLAISAFYNQLLVLYRDATSHTLHMIRSTDGKTWTIPETLYIPLDGGLALSVWRDRAFVSLITNLNPSMVSMISSSGISGLEFPTISSVIEVTDVVNLPGAFALQSYHDPSNNPALAQLFALAFDNVSDQYYLYHKVNSGGTQTIMEWKNTRSGALPNPDSGYELRRSFAQAPNETLIVTADKAADHTDKVAWLLTKGAASYTSFGTGINNIDYHETATDHFVYASNTKGGLSKKRLADHSWTPVNAPYPGGESVIIQLTDKDLLMPAEGYQIIDCATGGQSDGLYDMAETVTFANFTSQDLYCIPIAKGGFPGIAGKVSANKTVTLHGVHPGDCWCVAKDMAATQCIGYYKVLKSPFQNVEVTVAGDVYAVLAQPGLEGSLYYLNGSSWYPVGISATVLTSDSSGDLYAANKQGKVLKVHRAVGTHFVISSMGATFLPNIASIAFDVEDTLWVLTENHRLFRSRSAKPIASHPDCAVCEFNGQLTLAYQQDNDIQLINSVDGSVWSAPVALGVQAKGGPGIASFENSLWVSYISPYLDDHNKSSSLYVYSSLDGQNWHQSDNLNTDLQSSQTPAFSTFKQALDIAYVNNDNQTIQVGSSSNGQTWKVSASTTHHAGSAASMIYWSSKAHGYIVYAEATSNKLTLLSSADGQTWTSKYIGTTAKRPALAIFDNILVLAATDTNGTLQFWTSADGISWKSVSAPEPIQIPNNFAMCSFTRQGEKKAELYIFFVDGVGAIRTRTISAWKSH